MLHVRCHLLMSPENTTESSVWLMDNGDGTTVDPVLMQSNRGMMGRRRRLWPLKEPECNQDNQPGLTTPVAATACDRSRP
jgi:hypothetical protein